MNYKDLMVKTIADSGAPGSEPAKEVVEEQTGIVLSDLENSIERAASLGILVEAIILMIAKHYTDTHVCLLADDEGIEVIAPNGD